ncbi:hypothetical protein [Pseudoalteromonas rubra]|uniref:hypothetical protein n=1 Tax=Pseudoalteromonas rubra TaxID=43658 RepID=UPI000F7B5CE9|nr:hypothetical protein [Pseudoalteromonas rubra]
MRYLLFVMLCVNSAQAFELKGQADIEHRQFFAHGTQDNGLYQTSVKLEPEFYLAEVAGSTSLTVKPFARFDGLDKNRTHVDLREFIFLHVADDYELRAGVGKVFWGVTESLHLVDVINQTDQLEGVDGEDKLGQPMVQYSIARDWGMLDVFMLPYFRELAFPSAHGRLGTPFEVDDAAVTYESSQQEKHLDFALRYSQYFDIWELGVSYFRGTNREPLRRINSNDTLALHYTQMNQISVDLQGVIDSWLLKLEALSRNAQQSHVAYVTGFEHTTTQVFDSRMDLGVILEYQYDSRNGTDMPLTQNDLFFGTRVVANDIDGSELLAGVSWDLDDKDSFIFKLEASTRLTDQFRAVLEAYLFHSQTPHNPVYGNRKEDFLQLTLEYYF